MPVSTHGGNSESANQMSSTTINLATDIDDPAAASAYSTPTPGGAKQMAKTLNEHQQVGLTETTPPGLLGLAVRAHSGCATW